MTPDPAGVDAGVVLPRTNHAVAPETAISSAAAAASCAIDSDTRRDTARDASARHATTAASSRTASRRVSLSIAQLAAAAALLIAVSGATAWFMRGNTSPTPATTTAGVIQAEVETSGTSDEVRLVNFADAQYDAAVLDLERALNERRNDLNPRTVEILERNLKLIDPAIAQARQALEGDPGNQYLNRHLVESRHRKLELLRRATAITEGD